jgi:hypothetical protein
MQQDLEVYLARLSSVNVRTEQEAWTAVRPTRLPRPSLNKAKNAAKAMRELAKRKAAWTQYRPVPSVR